eukprot:gene11713-4947_t
MKTTQLLKRKLVTKFTKFLEEESQDDPNFLEINRQLKNSNLYSRTEEEENSDLLKIFEIGEHQNKLEKTSFKSKLIKIDNFILQKPWLCTMIGMIVNILSASIIGFQTGVVGPVFDPLTQEFKELQDPRNGLILFGLFQGCLMASMIFGPFISTIVVTLLGYKSTFIIFCFICCCSQAISIFTHEYWIILVSRSIIGASCGILFQIAPRYSLSIAPKNRSGLVGGMFLVGLTYGNISSNLVALFSLVKYSWRIMLAFGMISPIILFILSFFIPESPLTRHPSLQDDNSKKDYIFQMKELFTKKKNWKGVLICMLIIFSFMMGGIVSVVGYLPVTLEEAGFDSIVSRTLIATGIAFWDQFVAVCAGILTDYTGRRFLLGVGFSVMMFANVTLGFVSTFITKPIQGYLSIGLILIFFFGNDIGVNSVIYFIFQEVFDEDIREFSVALMTTFMLFIQFLVFTFFLPFLNAFGPSLMFLIFGASVFIFGSLVMVLLPETKPSYQKTDSIIYFEETNSKIEEILRNSEMKVISKRNSFQY